MRHLIKTVVIFTFLLLGVATFSTAQGINFSETSISNLKKGSIATEKPYFIYLYEEGCKECDQLEDLTFSDPSVSKIVKEHLLAGKINLQSKAGMKLMSKNKIARAPALLFYSKKGKLILQQESAMSSSDFLKLMSVLYGFDVDVNESKLSTDRFDNLKDFEISVPKELTSRGKSKKSRVDLTTERKILAPMRSATISATSATVPNQRDELISEAQLNVLKSADQQSANNKTIVSQPDLIGVQEGSYSVIEKSKTSAVELEETSIGNPKLISGEVTHRTIISTPVSRPSTATSLMNNSKAKGSSKQNKSIQFAAYVRYDDVLKGMHKMKKRIDAPLTIIEEYTKGKFMYKLVVDDQMTLAKAKQLRAKFLEKSIDCFIRSSP